jgi:hypothetical protein
LAIVAFCITTAYGSGGLPIDRLANVNMGARPPGGQGGPWAEKVATLYLI